MITPTVTTSSTIRLREGRRAGRSLAKSHYENFSVGSFLLPRVLRRDLFNIYAFCRLADDIADEAGGGVSRLEQLIEWGESVEEAATGRTDIPVFAALGETIRRRHLRTEPFHNLLAAFRQDLTVTRYNTWDDLLGYCRLSADPVGSLVLGVCGLNDTHNFAHSDKICTALQLANHWQDIAEDYERGRVYIPQEILRRFSVEEATIAERRPTAEFRRMMLHLIERTEGLFQEGRPLLGLVGKPLAPQLYLYWGGGMAALEAIKAAGGDVLTAKRSVGRRARVRLAAGALARWVGVV